MWRPTEGSFVTASCPCNTHALQTISRIIEGHVSSSRSDRNNMHSEQEHKDQIIVCYSRIILINHAKWSIFCSQLKTRTFISVMHVVILPKHAAQTNTCLYSSSALSNDFTYLPTIVFRLSHQILAISCSMI